MALAAVVPFPVQPGPAVPAPQRARGVGRLTVRHADGATRLVVLFQEGSAKLRLPRSRADAVEAVMINSGGGMTGGDRFSWTVDVGDDAAAVLTTQACEKVYRADADETRVAARLTVGAGARLNWLPQETILFDRSALARSVEADVAADGRLLLAEAVVLGRRAMGETLTRACFHDRWRVRRDGRLLFADDLRLGGDISTLAASPPLLGGAGAFATLLLVAPDAEVSLDAVRAAIGEFGGASAFDGKLVVRLAAPDGLTLRRALLPAIAVLSNGCPAPSVWTL
ncbi:MAG: urease accessory protein UreD [Caulobacterales bacterium]|nr:urease accessory protein UreD [Caulobacterales bacterium]